MKSEVEKEIELFQKEKLKFEKEIENNKLKTISELKKTNREDIIKNLNKPKKISFFKKLSKIFYGK